jgi:hypothetical protein
MGALKAVVAVERVLKGVSAWALPEGSVNRAAYRSLLIESSVGNSKPLW